VLTVVVVRGVGLLLHPLAPSARGERRWMGWAWRGPEVGESLAQVERDLPPGAPVVLAVDASQAAHAGWWRFQASYHLSENPVLGVEVGASTLAPGGGLHLLGEPPVAIARAQRISIGAGGQVEVERRGPGG
jgi:hypothetical protein